MYTDELHKMKDRSYCPGFGVKVEYGIWWFSA